MTDDEREEGARAIAAVMIGHGVAWDTLSAQVQERCKRSYDAATVVWVRGRERAYRFLPLGSPMPPARHAETFTDYPGDPLFGGAGDDGGGGL